MCAEVFAQSGTRSIYVSAKGDNKNDGFSEAKPMKSLTEALNKASEQSIKTITVIGTLDWRSDSTAAFRVIMGSDILFHIEKPKDITITGKPSASGEERAVISAIGLKNSAVVRITSDVKVRFEHIEISGGQGDNGIGLFIDNAQVTLGQGATVRNNAGNILIANGIAVVRGGTCIIDGGEVLNNKGGVWVDDGSILILRSGSIRDNSSTVGGGVYISSKGQFTMSGGNITGNSVIRPPTDTQNDSGGGGVMALGSFTMTGGSITNNRTTGKGGGVWVFGNNKFDQKGGTISGNFAEMGSDPNIHRGY